MESAKNFTFKKIGEKFGQVDLSDRISVVFKALNPKRTKDGRDFDYVAAYFGFKTEIEAKRFALWVERANPKDSRYLDLTTVRSSERTKSPFEVKVRAYKGIHSLIEAALKKEESDRSESVDRFSAPLQNRNSGRVLVGAGSRIVGID